MSQSRETVEKRAMAVFLRSIVASGPMWQKSALHKHTRSDRFHSSLCSGLKVALAFESFSPQNTEIRHKDSVSCSRSAFIIPQEQMFCTKLYGCVHVCGMIQTSVPTQAIHECHPRLTGLTENWVQSSYVPLLQLASSAPVKRTFVTQGPER